LAWAFDALRHALPLSANTIPWIFLAFEVVDYIYITKYIESRSFLLHLESCMTTPGLPTSPKGPILPPLSPKP
jgi:hypothetical protein